MPDLDCSVKTCYYNKEKNCCLNSIKVDGIEADTTESTSCASFRKKPEGVFMNSSTDRDPKTNLDIDCKARNCTFNRDYRCNASHIGIAGNSAKSVHETACASFYKE